MADDEKSPILYKDGGHNQSESVGQHPDLNKKPPEVGPGAGIDIDSRAMPKDGIIDIKPEDPRELDDDQLDVTLPQPKREVGPKRENGAE